MASLKKVESSKENWIFNIINLQCNKIEAHNWGHNSASFPLPCISKYLNQSRQTFDGIAILIFDFSTSFQSHKFLYFLTKT